MRSDVGPNDTEVWPAARERSERLALVLDRYMCELETTGLPPDVERLAGEHPDLADELRSYVDSLNVLHQMTTGLRPAAAKNGSVASGAKRLGDYEIVREIGRGGMGVVYEARQLSLNRQVALKVLPFAAMLDERQIARFRTEAQAAAQLHHPNIVPVHAVGQERGVHYFAMQFIAGQSLEAAIKELRGAGKVREGEAPAEPTAGEKRLSGSFALPIAERDRETVASAFSTRVSMRTRTFCHSAARLILQAADALHHAHQLGVLHRDVKPSNLLLDRDGKLWVTDFGLARIQTDSGVTISGDIVGTIRYMSPEQAAGQSALVDARTDVYSLGATLYELLTLEPAHRGEGRQEIMRAIESVEPPSPRSLNSAVPFDLETITLRALAKARDERYATAEEFADDLRRFLAGEPTHARRPTAIDRAAKWALRHRRTVSLAAVFLVVLSAVSIAAAVMIAREQGRTKAALVDAKNALEQKEEHYQQARDAVDELGIGVAKQLATLPGAERLRRFVLGKALDYYQQFLAGAAGDPELAADMAATYHKAASIAELLGDRQEALKRCREAIALFDGLSKRAAGQNGQTIYKDEQLQGQRAAAYRSLGLLLAKEGDGAAALDAYETSISLERGLVERQPEIAAHKRALAESYSNRGLLQGELGAKDVARESLRSSIELLEELLADNPNDAPLRHALAIGHNNLSFVERGANWDASEASCRQAVELLEKLVDEERAAAYRSDLALCYNNYGAILGHRNQWKGACRWYEKAIELQQQLTRQASAVVVYRRDLAVSLNQLGQAQQQLDDLPAALASFAAAEEIVAQLVDDYPNELTFRSLCGAVLNNRAMALEASHENDIALPVYEKAIEHQRVTYQRAPMVTEYREFLSKHYYNYGRALRAAGRPRDAAAAALKRRELWPEHGEHLGQIAIELALAAAQLRGESDAGVADMAAGFEAQAVETLGKAAAHGANLAALRHSKALSFLQDDAVWGKLDHSAARVVQ